MSGLTINDVPDPLCGRCGGPSGDGGAWCEPCIKTCREYTQRLDLTRLPELNTNTLAWAACCYARAGIPVLALRPGSKVPATKRGVDDATTDLRQIRSWWQRHPGDNIGLANGHLFDVLDVDTKEGRPGPESLTRLRLAGLTRGAWAAATTPSGGQHVLYAPSGDGNHADSASGLDFRGLGGYIVAAPSITQHGRYAWQFTDPDARGRPFDWQAAMEHLHGPAPRPEHRVQSMGDAGGLVGFLAHTGPGGRNTALHWAACRAHEQGLPTEDLLTAAVAVGLPEAEASRTIDSASRTIQRRPR